MGKDERKIVTYTCDRCGLVREVMPEGPPVTLRPRKDQFWVVRTMPEQDIMYMSNPQEVYLWLCPQCAADHRDFMGGVALQPTRPRP